ncbi:MAG: four helix bundle protein [Candidatus Cloacimonetes bacterium]|jgi:four helix bundle protein|nr:four helix bundle protein [Candidatus Cloacimonadota bacterium]
MSKNNVIVDKSFAFALKAVKLYEYLSMDKKEFVLSKQVLRSGTSIGANINEAIEAQSKADFIHKMSISLKEARETEYWLKLLTASGYINDSDNYLEELGEIIKILVSIVKTSRKNN